MKTLKTAIFTSTAEILEVPNEDITSRNPLLAIAKFVLLDDKGNDNNQGVEETDFVDIEASAKDMPVKMGPAEKHYGSFPIGHIINIERATAENGTKQLIAEAVLYKEEYPDEVEYLKQAHASGKAPGISWELKYKDSIVKNGVEWLKNIVTQAATFVKVPAYGSRTALLAIASQTGTEEQVAQNIMSLAEQWGHKQAQDEGGNTVDPKELKELQEKLEKAEKAQAELAAKNTVLEEKASKYDEALETIKTLEAENVSLKRQALISDRTAQYQAAGFTPEADAEKLQSKQAFWASMSDEDWKTFLAELTTVKSASASLKNANAGLGIPRPPVDAGDGTGVTIDDLKTVGRAAARPQVKA